ncbi:MAG: hypothetical protein V2I26_19920 [Halieaceae bacterium]|jgi:hypothetical protein|nr:hypothetical protein [Halieaceae bacterium]
MIGKSLRGQLRVLCIALPLLNIAGCSSFGRGVTEALLRSQSAETEDVRACTVEGEAFDGIAPILEAQAAYPLSAGSPDRATTKLVYIHGIGDHQPGHAGELVQSLSKSLDLTVRASVVKQIVLSPPDAPSRPFGVVSVIRMTDSQRRRELVFYELTWSAITAKEKESIAFDNSVFYSSQRAAVNSAAKQFANNALPDPLAFIGNRGDDIRGSVGQALCWALSTRWDDLPPLTEGQRCENSSLYGSRVSIDELVIASHSLGSRATVDALQDAARGLDPEQAVGPRARQFAAELKNKQITLYMLSNQLPLLETGQPSQAVTRAGNEFCGPDAPQLGSRFLKQLDMIAFTDPNDILSYPVPQFWVRKYLDSRLCTNVRNVTINIANVRRLPVIGTFADPISAHTGYDSDPRVAELIARGMGNDSTSALVRERCRWVEVDPGLD